MNLNRFLANYNNSPEFIFREARFFLYLFSFLILSTVYFVVHYLRKPSYLYAFAELFGLVILIVSIIMLIRGNLSISIFLSFVLYGNFYLFRTVVFPVVIGKVMTAQSLDYYYAYQTFIILLISYICLNKILLHITTALGLVFNISYSIIHFPGSVFSIIITSIMFVVLPYLLGLYIHEGKTFFYVKYRNEMLSKKELNHRIRNQLTLLKSMVNLKLKNSDNVFTEIDREVNRDVSNLISSFVHIYDQLLYSNEDKDIELNFYIRKLVAEYEQNFPVQFNLHCNREQLFIPSNAAVHIGMLIVEMIGNSLKHALTTKLVITINIDISDDMFYLVIYDSGKFDRHSMSETNGGFGSEIIKTIVEKSLKGQMEFDVRSGYRLTAGIPLEQN